MKSLETLNLSKNRISELPADLAKCTSLAELFLNDNDLIEVPTKISSMDSLKILEAERKFHQKHSNKKKRISIFFLLLN